MADVNEVFDEGEQGVDELALGEEEIADVGAESAPASVVTVTREQLPDLEGLSEGDPVRVMMEATVGAVNEDGSFDLQPVSFALEGGAEELPAGEGVIEEAEEIPPQGEEEGLGSALLEETPVEEQV